MWIPYIQSLWSSTKGKMTERTDGPLQHDITHNKVQSISHDWAPRISYIKQENNINMSNMDSNETIQHSHL